MEKTFLNILADWGCTQQDDTMERFLKDESFYYDILMEMLRDPGFEQLGENLKGNDPQVAFATAHTLKGIIANCGITPLLNQISKMVEPLRIGQMEGLLPDYEILMEKRKELKELLSDIQ